MIDLAYLLAGALLMLLGVTVGGFGVYVAQHGWPRPAPRRQPAPAPAPVPPRQVAVDPVTEDDEPLPYDPPPPPPMRRVEETDPYGGGDDEARSRAFYALQEKLQERAIAGENAGMLKA